MYIFLRWANIPCLYNYCMFSQCQNRPSICMLIMDSLDVWVTFTRNFKLRNLVNNGLQLHPVHFMLRQKVVYLLYYIFISQIWTWFWIAQCEQRRCLDRWGWFWSLQFKVTLILRSPLPILLACIRHNCVFNEGLLKTVCRFFWTNATLSCCFTLYSMFNAFFCNWKHHNNNFSCKVNSSVIISFIRLWI